MTRTCVVFTLTLAGLLGGSAQADAFCLRCVRLVCRPVVPCGVTLLGWRVAIPAPPVAVPVPPPPGVVPPMPTPAPTGALPAAPIVSVPSQLPLSGPGPVKVVSSTPVVNPRPVLPAVMTHQEFARIFKPAPGRYEVTLIHPGSKNPVPVSFTLPDGAPQVRVYRRELVFDYGRHEVEIRFAIGGRVRVTSR